MTVNKVHQLHGLLDMINDKYEKLGYNFHLVFMGGKTYEIVDLNNYQKIIKRGTLENLLGFCEGFLYLKY